LEQRAVAFEQRVVDLSAELRRNQEEAAAFRLSSEKKHDSLVARHLEDCTRLSAKIDHQLTLLSERDAKIAEQNANLADREAKLGEKEARLRVLEEDIARLRHADAQRIAIAQNERASEVAALDSRLSLIQREITVRFKQPDPNISCGHESTISILQAKIEELCASEQDLWQRAKNLEERYQAGDLVLGTSRSFFRAFIICLFRSKRRDSSLNTLFRSPRTNVSAR
jgi:chromosome segregation ATPase